MQLILNDSTINHLSQFSPDGQGEVVKNGLRDLQNHISVTEETYGVIEQALSSTELQETLDRDKHTIDILNVLHLRRLIESKFDEAINGDSVDVGALPGDIDRILKNDVSKNTLNRVSIVGLLDGVKELQKQAKQRKVESDLNARKDAFLHDFQLGKHILIGEVETAQYGTERKGYVAVMNNSTIASINYIRSIPEGTTVFEVDDFIEDIEVIDRFGTYIFIRNKKKETIVINTACPPIPRLRYQTSFSIRASYLGDVEIYKYNGNCQVIHERGVNIFFGDGKTEIDNFFVKRDSCVFKKGIDNSNFIQAESSYRQEIHFISCKTGKVFHINKGTAFEVINGVVTLPQVGFRKNKPNPGNFELHN